MSSLDMSATIPPLQMAETLYVTAGAEALETLESKLETGGHLLGPKDRKYAEDVCYWLRSLMQTERDVESCSVTQSEFAKSPKLDVEGTCDQNGSDNHCDRRGKAIWLNRLY